ncbi:MAG: hypothetical protein AB7U20_15885, partial [Planctomycetaceae bacterium]
MPSAFLQSRFAVFRGPLSAVLLMVLTVASAGCGRQETITQYAVPKEAVTVAADKAIDASASNPTAWFFKLDGPQEAVGQVEAQFTALVESVTFENGKPRWTVPDGWSEAEGSQMRFATLKVENTDPPLEVSVIPLPVFDSNMGEYLRQNIDRWRGQIGLEPSAGADWLATAQAAGEVRASSAGDVPVILVDLRGKTEKFDPARMLGAMFIPDSGGATTAPSPSSTPALAIASPSRQEAGDPAPLSFETPEGWAAGKASSMRAASFLVSDGGKQADVSAMMAGGDELANVNRWRGQVGLAPVSQDELHETAREV